MRTSFAQEKLDNRRALKAATARIHDLAENRWFSRGAFADQHAYMRWLAAMRKLHGQLGKRAAHIIANPIWTEAEERRLACLAKDLALTSPLAQLPSSKMTKSHAWGVLYALNGSALGATVLVKSPSIKQDWPRAYLIELNRFAKSGGVKDFFEQLNRYELSLADAESGAAAVFEALI